ncbi:MAG: potassium channel protein [Gemmatimonadetes bacterium]|jgi:Trk K+ transport system NAD-binding subunit|nr:potassium channel protein [Gemmatimonadota bacterium]MBT4608968.1 potassium channel protein [Gemmatimonadota bacterium]MBT5055318.1 potassium channel protein [Gemmatimonadota bacterium]MBT5142813.1 potassium channel protein [Gemmatimonadota bacterium]MBT5589405.1 potassium channel protein [Gemmatimonadota bacterium]
MRFFTSFLAMFMGDRPKRRNFLLLVRFLLVFALLIALYSVLFHTLMLYEGQEFTWFTGVYWTLTVMSTLGFGDITFHTDLGRVFSTVVLLSGTLFMLILLPFTFLQFFWTPWIAAQNAARIPRQLQDDMTNHVIITRQDFLTRALIDRLKQFQYPYVLVATDPDEAVRLHDEGMSVIAGDLDDPETYERARVDNASLVVSTNSDQVSTNVAATVRSIAEDVDIVAIADTPASVDILELAGCTQVLQLADMLGESLARRISAGDAMAHVLGEFDELLIAEATVKHTPLAGKTLAEAALRTNTGVSVVGVWERGSYQAARPETMIADRTVLVLAGTQEQLHKYDSLLVGFNQSVDPVIIIGAGRVGLATARSLERRGVDYRIVEQDESRDTGDGKFVAGSAAALEVLQEAGIDTAPAVVITTRDDDTNIYLAIYCRKLQPDIQVIARANDERNISTLHRAGTDFVMSYASMGASAIANMLHHTSTLMVAEGLELFRLQVPDALAGQSIAESSLRAQTGCTVVASCVGDGITVNPDPTAPLTRDTEIILIGTAEGERKFLELYS